MTSAFTIAPGSICRLNSEELTDLVTVRLISLAVASVAFAISSNIAGADMSKVAVAVPLVMGSVPVGIQV